MSTYNTENRVEWNTLSDKFARRKMAKAEKVINFIKSNDIPEGYRNGIYEVAMEEFNRIENGQEDIRKVMTAPKSALRNASILLHIDEKKLNS